jgi:adenylate cyclase
VATLVSRRALGAFLFPERGGVFPRPYAVVAVVGIAAGVALAGSDAGQRIEWYLYDQYARRQATGNAPAPDVVVVAIDELSFAEVGMAWPWPRSLHAALLDQLVAGGARTITFDIVFDVPGRDADGDRTFADAIRRAGNVILAADQAVIEDRSYAVTQWSEPIAAFAQGAKAVGVDRIPIDPDGVIRRALPAIDGRPSLAQAIASQVPGFEVPPGLDLATSQLFRFNGLPRRGVATVSYYQALDATNSLPPTVFQNKHVLIGRALEAAPIDSPDHFTTPVAFRMAGVEIHATIVNALLRGGFIRDPLASATAFTALCAVAAAAATTGLYFVGPTAAAATVVSLIALLIGAGYFSLSSGVRLPVAGPAIAVAVAYAVTTAYRFALVTRERRMIKRAFQHYVAPAIVEQMLNDPSKLKLGGEQREVTVLFSDLEGFTTLSEQLTPAQLSTHVGEYFTEMLDVLLPQHGTLDKLIGDSIMMYFGAPLPDSQHALHACRGALAMQRRMAALNDRWSLRSLPQLRTRIGINTGVAVAGNMGTASIFNYTILGDCVNLASRLEGVNKHYGTLTIVGEDTWKVVHTSFEGRELDWIRVKGRAGPVAIYELVGEVGQVSGSQREVFQHYAEGLARYREQRWSQAAVAFGNALQVDPADGPSRTLAARCAAYQRCPPTEWDGVHSVQSPIAASTSPV